MHCKSSRIKLRIAFDSYRTRSDSEYETAWGFSCLIGRSYLFDSGSHSGILARNLRRFGINLKDITHIFLSNTDWDHISGLASVFDEQCKSKLSVYVPFVAPEKYIEFLNQFSDKVEIIGSAESKTNLRVGPIYYSTGVIDNKDQSLIIKHENLRGLVVITGSAKAGIINIVERVKEMFPNEDILALVGGFGMLDKSEEEVCAIAKTLYELDVIHVIPTHSTGELGKYMLKQVFKEHYKPAGVGSLIEI